MLRLFYRRTVHLVFAACLAVSLLNYADGFVARTEKSMMPITGILA